MFASIQFALMEPSYSPKRGKHMNFKLNKLLAVSGVVAMAATCVPMAGAECLLESRQVGPGVIEYERTYTAPAATTVTTTMHTEKVLENSALIETAPTTTTTEKVFEQETEKWSGPSTMARRAWTKRRVAPRRHLTAHRTAARRRFVAYSAPRTKILTKTRTVVVEKPVIVEKQVAIERPVYIDRVVEKPVFIEKPIENPVFVEKVIEKPVQVETVIERPVIIKEKKHHGLLNLNLLRLKLL